MDDNRWNFDEIDWPTTSFPLRDHLVLASRRGSEAHGTYVPPEDATGIDDRDVLGIVVPPFDYYVGVRGDWSKAEAQSIKGPWDVVLYDARKYVRLLMVQNPNILASLWCEPEDYLYVSDFGRALLDMREHLKGRHDFHAACVGYAQGQLYKMTHGSLGTGYMGEKRKALVERFGYDCKNAAHLLRLLHMGTEFHKEGVLHVRRTWDREMLIDIKRGKYTLEAVSKLAEDAFHEANAAYAESVLPETVDTDLINREFTTMMTNWIFRLQLRGPKLTGG
jgi:predicted nucleotidyltransferase